MTDSAGELLGGGNSGAVRRIGATVRRPRGPWTPTIHALLRALRTAGFTKSPQPLGVDDAGREIVEYLEGDVGVYPMPDWVWADALLLEVAEALRELHDLTQEMDLPTDGWRRPALAPAEVICHGDIAPFNTVCRDGHLTAFIDWDHARPAPRGWDLGYAAYRWVSLTPPGHPDGCPLDPADRDRRLRLFCAAYRDVEPAEVVRWAIVRLDDLVAHSRSSAETGDPAFVATVAAGHADLYQADAAWLRREYPLSA